MNNKAKKNGPAAGGSFFKKIGSIKTKSIALQAIICFLEISLHATASRECYNTADILGGTSIRSVF